MIDGLREKSSWSKWGLIGAGWVIFALFFASEVVVSRTHAGRPANIKGALVPPLYLKDRRTNYWFEHLPNNKAVYFQFNLVVKSSAEPPNAFVERLFKFVDEHDIEKLIIDMRWNNGGNAMMLMPLINGLVRANKINRAGGLFVIVGRYTYSAAIPAAAWIERHTNAVFVGEPTPSGPNVIAESNIITLPYSRVRVSISDLYWQGSWPNDRRTWIAPLHFVPPSFEAFKAKRDPALELILAYPDGN